MLRLRDRSRVLAVLLVAAIGLAACGGSSSSSSGNSGNSGNSSNSGNSGNSGSTSGGAALSLSDYVTKANAAVGPVNSAIAALHSGTVTTAEVSQVQSAAKQASSTLSGLTPPSSVADLNSKLASSMNDLATAAGQALTDVKNNNAAGVTKDVAAMTSAATASRGLVAQLSAKTLGGSGSGSGSSGSS